MKKPAGVGSKPGDRLEAETAERRRFLDHLRAGGARASAATAPAVAMLLGATSKIAVAGGSGGGCGCGAVAEADGPYIYDATTTAIMVDPTGSTWDTIEWVTDNGTGTTFPEATPTIGIVDSGLNTTVDMTRYMLNVVVNSGGTSTSASDSADVLYMNAAPTITGAAGVRNPDGSVTFSADYSDADLGINSLIPDFELLMFEFDTSMATMATDIGDGFLSMPDTVDFSQLASLFGTGMPTAYANVADRDGAVRSFPFSFELSAPDGTVPEPATVGLIGAGLAGLGLGARRRRKKRG